MDELVTYSHLPKKSKMFFHIYAMFMGRLGKHAAIPYIDPYIGRDEAVILSWGKG